MKSLKEKRGDRFRGLSLAVLEVLKHPISKPLENGEPETLIAFLTTLYSSEQVGANLALISLELERSRTSIESYKHKAPPYGVGIALKLLSGKLLYDFFNRGEEDASKWVGYLLAYVDPSVKRCLIDIEITKKREDIMPSVSLKDPDKRYAWQILMPKKDASLPREKNGEKAKARRNRLYQNAVGEIAVATFLKVYYRCANIGGLPFGILYKEGKREFMIKVTHKKDSGDKVWTMKEDQLLDNNIIVFFTSGTGPIMIEGFSTAEVVKELGVKGESRSGTRYTIEKRRLFKPGDFKVPFTKNPTAYMESHPLFTKTSGG